MKVYFVAMVATLLFAVTSAQQRMCCRAMRLNCLSCSAGITEKEYCANPNLAKRTPECAEKFPVVSVAPVACCMSMQLNCLACSAGLTEKEYCTDPNLYQRTPECAEKFPIVSAPRACCMSMQLNCLACSAGLTEKEYCADPDLARRTPECAEKAARNGDSGVEIKIMYIADETVPCFGPFPTDCMQSRTNPSAEWEFFYDHINGFDFEPGFEYELEVAVKPVLNPPADGSSLSYQLVQVLSKTKTVAVDWAPEVTTKKATEDASASRVCCRSRRLVCLACNAGLTEEQFCNDSELSISTKECDRFVPAVPKTVPRACCMSMQLNCLACSAGLTEKEYCADPNLSQQTPECAQKFPVVPVSPRACCMSMQLNCLACSAGLTEKEYCADSDLARRTPECAEKFPVVPAAPRACCMSMQLNCLACSAGLTEKEYCANPDLARRTPECAMFVKQTSQPRRCCKSMKLECLACAAGVTEAEFCADPRLAQTSYECKRVKGISDAGVEIQRLYIADETVPCFGPFPTDCMQSRTNPSAEWEFFYDHINGFDFEPGFEYELEVAVKPVLNPPADGSSLSYQLVQVLSKTKTLTTTRALPANGNARAFVPATKATTNKPRFAKAVKTTATSAVITWVASAESGCDEHYRVQYRLRSDGVMGTWQTAERKQPKETMAVIEGLMSRRTYQVEVTPISKEGVEGTPTRHAFRTKKFK